jgi:phage-related protein
MKQGEFIVNGTSSKDLKSLIQFRPEISSPKRKVERKSIPGVSEDYIFDEEAYENTPINLKLFIKGQSEQEINQLKDEITYAFIGGRYIDFVPYWDSGMTYQVEVVEPPTFTQNGSYPLWLSYTVGLSAKPFKTRQKEVIQESTAELTLTNPYPYENQPIITLYGTGDMDLIVNGKSYVFKDIDDHVVVDSRIESAYKLITGIPNSRNNRMYTMDFPLLKSGENKLSVTGNATKFKVETRWKTLVS